MRKSVVKNIITMSLLGLLAVSCEKDEGIIYSGGDGTSLPFNYPVESEPSLSPDGKYVYLISQDTLTSENNGIYRAAVTTPRREQIIAGNGYHSPVASFSAFRIAFLQGARVSYLDMVTDSITSAGVPFILEAILYVNDSMFIGCDGNLIYLVNQNDSGSTRFGFGDDPTYYAPNRFVTVSSVDAGRYAIVRFTLTELESGFEARIDTLDFISSNGAVRWVSINPSSGRYVYIEQIGGVNSVYTSQIGDTSRHFIAETDKPKAIMLGFNLLIYSGPDGRFYQSNFEGTYNSPFWHAEQTN